MASTLTNFSFHKISGDFVDLDIKHIKSIDGELMAASTGVLFYFNDIRSRFYPIFKNVKLNDQIQDFDMDRQNRTIYIVLETDVFYSKDLGVSWNHLFSLNNTGKCLAIKVFRDHVYLGTSKGLYLFSKNEKGMESSKFMARDVIYQIRASENLLYFNTGNSVVAYSPQEQVFTTIFKLNDEWNEELEQQQASIFDMTVSAEGACLNVLAQDGIYESNDHGRQWRLIFSAKILPEGTTIVRRNEGAENGLLIASAKGFFVYEKNEWRAVYKGLHSSRLNDIAVDQEGKVYLASDFGIYQLTEDEELKRSYQKEQINYEQEPSIQKLHEIVIEYADVSPDKIRHWQELAKKKAWLPSVSIGLDGDNNRTKSDSVWGSYSSGGQCFIGPDDKTVYDNFSWGVSFTWNLDELIWSGDLTSIDSRAKLMVDLREDLLEQVTRVYFERRRLQLELQFGDQFSEREWLERRLRIEELTALIDGMTGGQFSKMVKSSLN